MKDDNSSEWSKGLNHLQFMKNKSYNSGIKTSSYESMFGFAPKVGLSSSNLPKEIYSNITDEQYLIKIVNKTNFVEKNPHDILVIKKSMISEQIILGNSCLKNTLFIYNADVSKL